MGSSSLRFFYTDVFKDDTLLMALYMLQDIELNYGYLSKHLENLSPIITENLKLIGEIKQNISLKLFGNQQNYYINKKYNLV